MNHALPLVAVLLVVALVSGCGGGGDDNSSSAGSGTSGTGSTEEQAGYTAPKGSALTEVETSSLTKPEFIKSAEQICTHTNASLFPAFAHYLQQHPAKSKKEEARIAADGVQHALIPKFEQQIVELHDLGAPEGDEREIEGLLAAMAHAVKGLDRRAELPAAPEEIDREFAQAGELALDYGLVSCAN